MEELAHRKHDYDPAGDQCFCSLWPTVLPLVVIPMPKLRSRKQTGKKPQSSPHGRAPSSLPPVPPENPSTAAPCAATNSPSSAPQHNTLLEHITLIKSPASTLSTGPNESSTNRH
ncbi:hypothetical protein PtA15_3A408 [Puccinia triticina]|uniref:Uncharacterized protein n=1 Tax=Puccinia triticina TaxID=208348 RepID=A0ABY7CGH6_9BASI|nr:uncharacterized protein PtA15_3A408 [Puccinia triticina]WAQ83042.1 hypothetical protein PtA15_3A408 [Puccinia triticina]